MRFSPRFILCSFWAISFLLTPVSTLMGQENAREPMAVARGGFATISESQSAPPSAGSFNEEPRASTTGGGQEPRNDQPQLPSASSRAAANIHGTVTDVYGDLIPEATVVLDGADGNRQTVQANDNGAFQFDHVDPGVSYHITVDVKGFEQWRSPALILKPGQYFILQNIKLKVLSQSTSVTVYASPEQIATQQVIVEERQRVFGIIPNFYVTYDKEPVPLTPKLKFRLALKADTDVMTFVGVAFISAIYQAGDIPDYGQGWDAYGKRMAAGYADTSTDIFIGGAILPWMLHQDPRYFYQGTGTTRSRFRHAVFSPFVCKGDNGKTQPNYSSIGGDLASGAISNLYYPESNRGAGLVFQGFLVTTGVRMVNGLLQEFVLRKLTPSARAQQQ